MDLADCCAIYELISTPDAISSLVNLGGNSSECNEAMDIINACNTPTYDAFQTNLQFYPNPVTDQLTVQHQESNLHFTLFHTNGTTVKTGILKQQDQIDFKKLERGAYFLKIENGTMTAVHEILKIK